MNLMNIFFAVFTHVEMYPEKILSQSYFDLNNTKAELGCKLCFQQDCKNGGEFFRTNKKKVFKAQSEIKPKVQNT